jgi:proteic killer suppression protein
MTISFASTDTENLFKGKYVKAFDSVITSARLKLTALHIAANLSDLRAVPGSRLEQLSGDRAGQHSIRINKQYRICFVWVGNNATQVEVDKHCE